MMRSVHNAIRGTEHERMVAFAGIVSQAVAELIRQGHTPISFSADVAQPGLPTILVASGKLTAQAVEKERAVYFKFDNLDGIPKRWGKLLYPPPGVNVIWIERGH